MLMVRSNLSARSRKEGNQGAVAILREERSKVVYLKTQIQWILFYGKLENADWTLRRDTPWNSGDAPGAKLQFGKEKDNLEALSKKVNLVSEILARPVLRRNTWGNLTTSRLWQQKQRGTWQKSTMRSKSDLSSDKMDSLRRSRNPTTVLSRDCESAKETRTHKFLFMISICS